MQSEGGYSDYLIRKELEKPEDETIIKKKEENLSSRSNSKNDWKQNRETKLKFSYKEQKEFETIDDDIARLEAKVEKLDADMMANATNSVKLKELMAEKEAAEQVLEEKMNRWVYLNDLNEKIQQGKE